MEPLFQELCPPLDAGANISDPVVAKRLCDNDVGKYKGSNIFPTHI